MDDRPANFGQPPTAQELRDELKAAGGTVVPFQRMPGSE